VFFIFVGCLQKNKNPCYDNEPYLYEPFRIYFWPVFLKFKPDIHKPSYLNFSLFLTVPKLPIEDDILRIGVFRKRSVKIFCKLPKSQPRAIGGGSYATLQLNTFCRWGQNRALYQPKFHAIRIIIRDTALMVRFAS